MQHKQESTAQWPRRAWMQATAAAAAGLVVPASWAQFKVEISGVGATQVPLALVPFRDEGSAPQAVSALVRADLERSGLFKVLTSALPTDEAGLPAYPALRTQGADAVVAGSITRLADGRFDVRYKLWDVVKGQDLGGQSYAVPAADLRLAAHKIADAIYERLTGDKGVFATRIAYITKGGGKYSLRITDADGEGGQVALTSPEPIISPAWSPDGRELAYVSFELGKAIVWIQETSSGQRRQLANYKGSNSAPAFSPDGRELAVTLSREGGSQIYLVGRDGGNLRRVTQSSAIDTEPVFSPDGKSIYFVSDRGGSPQIYRQATSGGGADRVTFTGNYNISPAISPDGKTLAFVQRQGGAFRVMTMDLASGQAQTISETSDDESPSFAPNGRLLIYATRVQGREVLMTSTLDGKIKSRLLTSGLDIREPVWGPFGR